MPGLPDLLVRSLVVLRACAAGPQRFGDLRERLGLSATTIARLLRALVAARLLRQDAEGRYASAPGSTALALDLLGIAEATEAAPPALEHLARGCGASAAFWQLAGRRLILVAKHEVADGFHYIDRFAHRPPEGTVFGLALLAALPADQRQRHLKAATRAARRLLATAITGGALAGTLEPETSWRVAQAVVREGSPMGVVGISRPAPPSLAVAKRDRSCVAAAARRLGDGSSA